MKRSPHRLLGAPLLTCLSLLLATACTVESRPDPMQSTNPDPSADPSEPGPGAGGTPGETLCMSPVEGCACDIEGESEPCGKVVENHGDYVTCSEGFSTCDQGRWTACLGTRRVAGH